METSEFDKFADEYLSLHRANISASGEAPAYFAEYKVRDFRAVVSQTERPQSTVGFLDFGAGTGYALPFFPAYFPGARVTCVDVSHRSLAIAASRFPNVAAYIVFDGKTLPFADDHFDGAYANCVFHHIPLERQVPLLEELRRVVAPGAPVMVYEHNPLNPITVHAVNTCAFDENAVLIRKRLLVDRIRAAGFRNVRARYRVFFPRALRKLRPAERWLTWLPLGAQYYVTGTK